jgi:hypothetical protein
MPLQYDPDTSGIGFEGQVVGRYDYSDGFLRVCFARWKSP